MLNLASLCFPDREKSCFFCCPPIRDPAADPLDDVAGRRQRFRENRYRLAERLRQPREINGESCWGLGFLDDEEKQIGCLLHPLQNHGRDLRHLTGYQFKCANALCREAEVFAALPESSQQLALALCRGMDSFTYSSRTNPVKQLLCWEREVTGPVLAALAANGRQPTLQDLVDEYGFLWQKLDFRLDGYLAGKLISRRGVDFLCRRQAELPALRQRIIIGLTRKLAATAVNNGRLRPCHCLDIPLSLSRMLKFGADIWELPEGIESEIVSAIESEVKAFV